MPAQTARSAAGRGVHIPPHDEVAEQAILGGLLLDPQTWDRVKAQLVGEDFFLREHRLIFRAIQELSERDQPVDALTLRDRLEARGETDAAGGRGYLIRLATETPSAANIQAYAQIVRAHAIRRQLIEAGTQITADAHKPGEQESEALLHAAERRISSIARRLNHRQDEVTDEDGWPAAMHSAAYHGITGDFVRTVEPHSEADPSALLVQFLAAAGSCIGRRPFYRVEGDNHHANLYAVMVGATSKGRKGTSEGRVREPFLMLEGETWATESIQSGLSSGEGVIWAVRDGKGDDPGAADNRLFIKESEFAGLLRIMMRDGNIVSRVIRDAWDRGDLGVMTKAADTKASNAHITIIGHITRDELTRYLDRTEAANGFANRFLYVAVRRSKCLPHGGNLNSESLRPFARQLAKVIHEAREIGQVTMDQRASTLWEALYPDLSEGKPGLFGAVVGRAEAQVVRLALIYALLDCSNLIRVEHLRAALSVWEYAEASAKYIFGASVGDPVADQILRALSHTPAGLTRSEISRALSGHVPRHRLESTLARLAALNRVEAEREATGGRPREIWRITK